MNTIYSITKSSKNKHLLLEHYEFIINAIIKHQAIHGDKVRNTGKTELIKHLASSVGTTVSNVYSIINAATISVLDSNLNQLTELSAIASFNKRNNSHKIPNNSKLLKATDFINLVIDEVKSNKLSSIDETIYSLVLHHPDKIKGMTTVSTKTFYNYVHSRKIPLKPIDLPRMLSRKHKKNDKKYIPKRQKGTSITERPFPMEDRSQFGHWEGDLVTGPRDGKQGAILTLIERKTRFYLMIPIKSKKAKNVYMMINQLHKFYGDDFSKIFKSITFDNGSEFSRYKDIEIKPGTKIKRTSVYFGRPYRSSDRGSNENCNGLIRYFIKKGTAINGLKKSYILTINRLINQKSRKILGYLPASQLFLNELSNISVTNDKFFYDFN